MKTSLQKIGMLIAVLFGYLSANAYDFEVDGIYYDVISLTKLTCEVTSNGYNSYSGDIVIPSEVKYNNRTFSVTKIGGIAFCHCSSLTSVTIPDSVTEIGDCTFCGCSSLTSVTIPDSVTKIGSYAFKDCSSLTSLSIPDSVTEIGEVAFWKCSSLVSIKLSNSLKSISHGLFFGCKSLESLSIPGSVEDIVQYDADYCNYFGETFGNCDNLKILRIEYSPEELGAYWKKNNGVHYEWFDWTKRIEVLYIDRALKNYIPVPNLERLELGANLQTVEVKNIRYLDKLTTIESHALVPPTLPEMSNFQYMNLDVIVPEEAFDAYQADENWGMFWNLQSGVDGVKFDSKKEEIGRYDMNGRAVSEDYQGMMIVRFSDGSCKKMLNR